MPKIGDDRKRFLIEVEHLDHGKSLRLVERENGLSNDTLRKFAKKHGIETRGRVDSIRANLSGGHISYPSGHDHWRAKDKEASARLARTHSDRMKVKNPSWDAASKLKISSSLCKTLKNKPTFHESLMIEFLDKWDIPYEHQFQAGTYIADFRICCVLVELDGRGHASREASDRVRDKTLTDLGFYVVRIQQDGLFNKRTKSPELKPYKLMSTIKSIIKYKAMISDFWHFSGCLIPDGGKYRVVVRQPNGLPDIIC